MADNVKITQGTQTDVATDDVSSVHYQKVKLDIGADGASSPFTGTITENSNLVKGTITSVQGGTIGNLDSGSVVVTVGTFTNTGTNVHVSTGTITAGTTDLLKAGTVSAVNNVVTGTLARVGTILNLNTGTIERISGGSIVVTAGTVDNSEIAAAVDLSSTISSPTTAPVGAFLMGYDGADWNAVLNGAFNSDASPLTDRSVPVNARILGYNAVTNQYTRNRNGALTFGTLGTAGGSFFGTISAAAGAGTFHQVSSVDISQVTGTSEILVLFGTALTGGSVITQGAFAPGGGISKSFPVPVTSGTNSEITYHFVGAGTARISVSYWKVV